MGTSCCFTNLLQVCRTMETALCGLQQSLISDWLKGVLEGALWIWEAYVSAQGESLQWLQANLRLCGPCSILDDRGRAWAAMSWARSDFATWSYANVSLSALPGASPPLGDLTKFSRLKRFLTETMVPWSQFFPHIFSGLQENLLWKEVISIYYSWKL